MKALLAIVFLFPILLAAIVLPSPGSDLREHINLGLAYRFTAFAAPPLQTWLAGAVALTGARDAWLYIAVAQVLNFIGLAYLVLIARRFIDEAAPVPLTIMFCGSIYFSIFSLTMAINADQIQVPLWAGIVFHGMMALRDDRWRDWISVRRPARRNRAREIHRAGAAGRAGAGAVADPRIPQGLPQSEALCRGACEFSDHRAARGAGMV